MKQKTEILGVGFDSIGREELTSQLNNMLIEPGQGYVVTPNPEILQCAEKDDSYREVLNGASLCVADGVGVVWASRVLGKPLKERIPGVEIGEQMLSICAAQSRGVFLLGGEEGVADAAAQRMGAKYAGLIISGTHHGYFDKEDNDRIVSLINESGAEVLFVCMGFPYQEKWIAEHIGMMPAIRLAFALGGSLDVYSGKVKRAPRAFCAMGLEWLWRAFSSYSHFCRAVKLPIYIFRVLKESRRGSRKNR